jgi:hypothetical protein
MSARQNTYYKRNEKTKRLDVGSKMLPGALLIPILVFAAGVALGYLWLCSRNEDIGKSIKTIEERKKDLDRRVVNEEYKWANATSPDNVRRLLKVHHLEMELPKERSVVRVTQKTDGVYVGNRNKGTELAKGGGAPDHE